MWAWENRLKLLSVVTLVYQFLLSLLSKTGKCPLSHLLRFCYHRTGKRYRETPAPLYRLRWALSRLWIDYRPTFFFSYLQNSILLANPGKQSDTSSLSSEKGSQSELTCDAK
jgi:hypothetical protein